MSKTSVGPRIRGGSKLGETSVLDASCVRHGQCILASSYDEPFLAHVDQWQYTRHVTKKRVVGQRPSLKAWNERKVHRSPVFSASLPDLNTAGLYLVGGNFFTFVQ